MMPSMASSGQRRVNPRSQRGQPDPLEEVEDVTAPPSLQGGLRLETLGLRTGGFIFFFMIFDGWDIFGRSRTLTLRKTSALLPSHASSRLEECCWFRKSLWFQQDIILNKGLSSLSRSQQPGEQGFLLNSCTARRTGPMPGFAYFNKLQRGYFFVVVVHCLEAASEAQEHGAFWVLMRLWEAL